MTKNLNPILVTGAAGFIGARLVHALQSHGKSIISVDHPAHFEDRIENQGIHTGQRIDREDLWKWLEDAPQLDCIYHLGAISDTREASWERLNHFNLNYSKRLWSWATQHQVPFFYASSAATYGGGEQGYSDDEAIIPKLKPLNSYGESKQIFDLWVLDQENSGSTPPQWAGFKFFNVYGWGEAHKKFMASVVLHAYQQIQEKGSVTLFKSHREGIADGQQKRDFVAIDDVVEVLQFARNGLNRGIYNLGTGEARSFLDLAQSVFAALNRPENIHFIETPINLREKYQYFTQAEMSKLAAAGYSRPFLSLEEGVKRYIQILLKS